MTDFIEKMFRKLADIKHIIIVGIAQRYGNNLLITRIAIVHFKHANCATLNQRHRLNSLRAKNKNIQRIPVISIGARNKTIIRRIMRRSVQNAVKAEHARRLIQFVFVFSAALDFDNSHKAFRRNQCRINVMPNVHFDLHSQCHNLDCNSR